MGGARRGAFATMAGYAGWGGAAPTRVGVPRVIGRRKKGRKSGVG